MLKIRGGVALILALLLPPSAVAAPQAAVGEWSGNGRFFDVTLASRYGGLPVEIVIAPDLTVSGRFGRATIPPTVPARRGKRLDYRLVLTGNAVGDPGFRKDHLILLIQQPDVRTLDVDFHLKTRFSYEFDMVVGNVRATRKD